MLNYITIGYIFITIVIKTKKDNWLCN